MPLIVGLGNPGRNYEDTPHNIGFEVVNCLAERWSLKWRRARIAEAEEAIRAGEMKTVLLRPTSFMNRSGYPVASALHWHGFKRSDLLLVCDDVNLPPGTIRIRAKGGAGGQKGLKSVIEQLGSDAFARLRIGVGGGDPGADVADYVLTKPTADLRRILQEAINQAADAIECFVRDGLETSMNQYNSPRVKGETNNPSGTERVPDNESPKGDD